MEIDIDNIKFSVIIDYIYYLTDVRLYVKDCGNEPEWVGCAFDIPYRYSKYYLWNEPDGESIDICLVDGKPVMNINLREDKV